MFTGLIQAVGVVRRATRIGREMDLSVDLGGVAEAAELGASIALSGVCCTVTARRGTEADFRLSEETLRRTWLGGARPATRVNVEPSLRVGDPMGGHWVQGHVDGVGEVTAAIDARAGGEWEVRVPDDLARYCVEKGSVALDGVSLTIAALRGGALRIAVIPHTAAATTLGTSRVGDPVHVEVDILAKYVERLTAGGRDDCD